MKVSPYGRNGVSVSSPSHSKKGSPLLAHAHQVLLRVGVEILIHRIFHAWPGFRTGKGKIECEPVTLLGWIHEINNDTGLRLLSEFFDHLLICLWSIETGIIYHAIIDVDPDACFPLSEVYSLHILKFIPSSIEYKPALRFFRNRSA